MTTTTGALVLAGIETALLATTLTTDADFGALHIDEDDLDARSSPRGLRVEPLSDGHSPASNVSSYRRLGFEVGISYPRDRASRAIMLVDAPLIERRIRQLGGSDGLLAALATPVVETRKVVPIEGEPQGASAQVRLADTPTGTRYLLVFRAAIDYLTGSA